MKLSEVTAAPDDQPKRLKLSEVTGGGATGASHQPDREASNDPHLPTNRLLSLKDYDQVTPGYATPRPINEGPSDRVAIETGKAASAAFGSDPLSPTDKEMGSVIAQTPEQTNLLRTFNKAIVQSGLKLGDAAMRGGMALLAGGTAAMRQTLVEMGVSKETAGRIERDLNLEVTRRAGEGVRAPAERGAARAVEGERAAEVAPAVKAAERAPEAPAAASGPKRLSEVAGKDDTVSAPLVKSPVTEKAPPPAVKTATGGVIDDLKRTFAPASRGPEASATAGMVREGLATREREFQVNAERLRGFGREVGNLPAAERFAFIDAIERGDLRRYEGTPMGELGSELRRLFDDRWAKMEQRGIAPNYVQDYFPHLWRDPGAAADVFRGGTGRSLEGGKAFKKERTFATLREGMDAGLQPVTDNPIELSLMQLHQMDKYITAQDIFSEMKTEGIAVQVPHDERPPAGWVPIDDKMARGANGRYYAPEQAATILNRALSPGLEHSKVYNIARAAGNMMNSAQLGLSGFHALFVLADASTSKLAKGVQQISRGTLPEIARGVGSIAQTPISGPINYMKGWKVMKQYLGRGQYGPEMEKIVDALVAGGGRVSWDQFYRASPSGAFWQSMRGSLMPSSGRQTLSQDIKAMFDANQSVGKGGITGSVVRTAAQMIPRVMDTIMAPIMQDLVPKMKTGVFFDLMQDQLRINPNMSRAELRSVAGKVWDSVDNRLGQLVYDNLFWDKTMRDIGHVGVRSLGWNLGTIREGAGGVLDAAKGREITPGGMKQITNRTAYTLAVPIATAMMGAFYGYLKTGKGPQEMKDYFFPKTGGVDAQGGENRASMPGYFKDYYEWLTAPLQTAENKVHPMWPAIYDMMTNQKWNGAAITDPQRPMAEKAGDYGKFIAQQFGPFSLQRQSGQGPESGISGPERFFGIREAPYAVREPGKAESFERRTLKTKLSKLRRDEAKASAP